MGSIKEANGYTTKNENKLLGVTWHCSCTKKNPF